jgi:HEAT repeat protein
MIAELRDRDGVDVLVDASADADVRVRRRAATALRILADRRSAPRLRAVTRSETDLGVLKSALAALGKLGLPRDVGTVAPFLTHDDLGVRVVAAGALAMLGDERGLDLVLQAAGAADPGAQKSATYALGLFRAPAAGTRLDAILADPQAAWRAYALLAQAERALFGQPPARQVELLDQFAQIRSRTVAEWAVDRLTDLGGADAEAALRRASQRSTPVGRLAARRLMVVEARP